MKLSKGRFENTGPKKLATITALSMDAGERVFFGITADMCIQNVIAMFSHAVLMLVRKSGDYINRTSNFTGTFGASALYWWSRLAGLLGGFGGGYFT